MWFFTLLLMKKKYLALLTAILIISLVGYLFFFFANSKGKKINVLLIECCTLRADHMSCYGYGRDTTPFLSSLAQEGSLFTNTFSQSTWTAASNASLFTSLYPVAFRSKKSHIRINEEINTLAEVLKRNGYTTCAVSSNANVFRKGGFAQGFDSFYELWKKGDSIYKSIKNPEIFLYPTAQDVNSVAKHWLKNNYREKFFLFVLYIDPHFPYLIPEGSAIKYDKDYNGPIVSSIPQIAETLKSAKSSGKLVDEWLYFCNSFWKRFRDNQEDRNHIIALYDSKISYLDKHAGQLIATLEELGIKDDTLIIFTSDHGESLFEREMRGHHGLPYDEQIHIPLLISYPNRLPVNKIINSQVQLIDIMPTILDILDLSTDFKLQGKSLLPYIMDEKQTDINHWTYTDVITENNVFARAIRDQEWKLITTDKPRKEKLYNLQQDPEELHDVAPTKKKALQSLKGHLADYQKNIKEFGFNESLRPRQRRIPDQERLEQLRALGYIQ